MEKDKMIEEMYQEFLNYKFEKSCPETFSYKGLCEHFYEQNYRKIPEGSVVLDRHEHQKYCAYKIIEPQIKGCLDRERKLEQRLAVKENHIHNLENEIDDLKTELKQARKETAEKILAEVAKTCGDYQWFKNLCKQFGVEVKE